MLLSQFVLRLDSGPTENPLNHPTGQGLGGRRRGRGGGGGGGGGEEGEEREEEEGEEDNSRQQDVCMHKDMTQRREGREGGRGEERVSLLLTCLMNFSLRTQVDPKDFTFSVMFSFVCESKVGFSMRQFTNTHRWPFMWNGFRSIPPLFFFFAASRSFETTWSTT